MVPTVEYLPIDGLPEFRAETTKLILGKDSPAIAEGRVACCQSLSGTGALRLAAEFIAVNLGKDRRVFVSDPTWGNHHAIFAKAGLEVVKYSYFCAKTKGLDFSGMMADLDKVSAGDIVLLHGCAHNPTGVDPTMEQWHKIAALVKAKGVIPFFDCVRLRRILDLPAGQRAFSKQHRYRRPTKYTPRATSTRTRRPCATLSRRISR